MTDYLKSSQLPAVSSAQSADLLELQVDGGGGTFTSKTITVSNFKGGMATGVVTAVFDGAGTAPAAGLKCYVSIPYAGTITSWTIIADVSGSIAIDVWKTTYAGAPPTVSNTIVNGNYPLLSSAQKNTSSSLGGWSSVAISAGDVMAFNVNSASTLTKATIVLSVAKT